MSWDEGYHCLKESRCANTNKRLSELEGDLSARDAQVAFAQFCCANPSFTVGLLMGIDLYPFQDIMIRAMNQKDYFLGVCGRGIGKCLSYNDLQKVIVKNRGLISITDLLGSLEFKEEEYIKEIPEIELWNGKSYQKTNKILVQKGKPCSRVKTRMGYDLEGSTNHKIKILDQKEGKIVWKRYHELDIENDFVCISRTETLPCEADQKQINEAYLCGLLIGDGSLRMVGNSFAYSYTTMDQELLNFILPYTTQTISEREDNKSVQVRLTTGWAGYLCNAYGLKPGLSYDKVIPQQILKNKSMLKACIQGIADTDGGREMKGAGVSICTTSIVLAKQLHLSFLNFGIISKLREKQTSSGFGKAWMIQCYGIECKKFDERIGFRLKRKKIDYKLDSTSKYNTNIDVLPGSIDLMQKIQRECGFSARLPEMENLKAGKNRDNFSLDKIEEYRRILKEKLEKLISFDGQLDALLEDNFFFDKIESIENTTADCIDFCDIPDGASYWSNGFISHNSTIAAIFIVLYAIFNPGVEIGVTSATFRQARKVFERVENMAASPRGKFLRQCIIGKIGHRSDAWEMVIGRSKIVAIPLSGDKIRGYRFNLLVIDELLLLSEKVINEVLLPFMAIQIDPRERQKVRESEDELVKAGLMKEEDKTIFPNNKLIGLTSASYEFEYLYEMFKNYKEMIFDQDAKNVSHAIMQLSCDMAPPGLYDLNNVEQARKNYSKAQFDREYMARFTGDSSGYYSARKLHEVSLVRGQNPTVKIKGDPAKSYLLAVDPNYDSSEGSDHFAMNISEIDETNEQGFMVHGYAVASCSLQERMDYFRYIFDNFNIVYVIVDKAGGEKFIKDVNDLGILPFTLEFFEAEFEEFTTEELFLARNSYNNGSRVKKIVHSQYFSPQWIRFANETLSADIDNKRFWFAAPVDAENVNFENIKISELKFSELESYGNKKEDLETKRIDFVDHQSDLIKLTKNQCSLIEVSTSATGMQRFDLPPNLQKQTGPNKTRKDSYSALVLANWGLRCFFAMLKTPEKKKSSFRPKFIA